MIKKWIKLLIISIVLLLLIGCWDYRDIDKRAISISIGVDRVNGKIEFSGEIAKLTPSSGGDKEKAQTSNVYKLLSYGDTYEQARIHYDSVNPYPTFLGATRVVVFSRNFAKESIEPYLNRINKFYDYRKTLLTVITREPPKEIFEVKVEKDISVGFLIENIVSNLEGKGLTISSSVGEQLSDIALGKVGYMLPYVGIEEEAIKYLGLAVLKNSKLVNIIDFEDTEGILYLLADNPVLTEVLSFSEDEKNKYSIRTSIKKRKIKTDYKDENPVINIDIDLIAQIQYQYYIEPISDDKIKKLEDMLSKKVKKDIIDIFKKSQKEFECDIFGFARYFRADNPKVYEKIDWEKEYIKADINVNIKTKINNLGLVDPNAKKKY